MMSRSSLGQAFAVSLCVALATGVATAAPAGAVEPEVELGVSADTVNPGDTVTVTETITNIHDFSMLHPTARLSSTPTNLTAYTELVGCTGAASCSTVEGDGGPVGYQAALAEALSGAESATVTFTLRVRDDAPDLLETLRGQLVGSNYASEPVDGPTLRVDATADTAVALSVRPEPGLLSSRLNFTLGVTANGPAPTQDLVVTTSLPDGMTATTSNSACTPADGVVTCTAAELAEGEARELHFSVKLGLLDVGVPYTFQASRTSARLPDPLADNDVSTVRCTVLTPLLIDCGTTATNS